MELMEEIKLILHRMAVEHMISLGGMVRLEYYEQAQEIETHFKEKFLSLSKDEKEKPYVRVWGRTKMGNRLPKAIWFCKDGNNRKSVFETLI
jgi:flavoprotein